MNIIVIGGGPSGMMAAISAASHGESVTLIEKNDSLGKKLLLTGHGRCNVTNATQVPDFFEAIHPQPRFLYSSFSKWNQQDTMDFFENHGCPLMVADANRVFPKSQKAKNILSTLLHELQKYHVTILLNHRVKDLLLKEKTCTGVILDNQKIIEADAVILTTGGQALQATGSSGDGYQMVKNYHKIIPATPALVPLSATLPDQSPLTRLQGITLKNIIISLYNEKKLINKKQGDLLFTHYGISGPVILNMSYLIQKGMTIKLTFLDETIIQNCFTKKQAIGKLLKQQLPSRLCDYLLTLIGIDSQRPANQLSKAQRLSIINILAQFPLTDLKRLSFQQAMITQGGINLKEVDPKTMASKKINHLYFAGEILDLNADTGGYNLQIAWTTGYVAGLSAVQSIQ